MAPLKPIGADLALNPTMGVDSNPPSYIDPNTGAIQTDKLSGAVVVAWNTVTTPFTNADPAAFNQLGSHTATI